jgi:hypothetical protein
MLCLVCAARFVKIDTEGSELKVLRGAAETIRASRQLGMRNTLCIHSDPGEQALWHQWTLRSSGMGGK